MERIEARRIESGAFYHERLDSTHSNAKEEDGWKAEVLCHSTSQKKLSEHNNADNNK